MNEVRKRYLRAFHKGLADLKAEGRECYPEVRVELNSNSSREFYRLWVLDVLEKKPDGSTGVIEFNIDPVETIFPGLPGTRPLVWNSITFSCARSHFDEADLLAWGERWIHDESPPLGSQDNLTGIIHSITQPEVKGDLVSFSIDFGSAPLQAFDELLLVLAPYLESAISVLEEGAGDA
jgi:hypothetical protein